MKEEVRKLREQNRFLRSLLKSFDDIRKGRTTEHDFRDE